MPAIAGPFPYNIDNLLGGAVRVLYAPITEPIPASIDDVIAMVSPYAPVGAWEEFGATKDAFSYSRGFETSGYEIQQVPEAILEEVTSITRTISVSVAELTKETLQILEEAGAPTAVAAGAGVSAQDVVEFGSFTSLSQYRVAYISRRNKASGLVTEPGGATRGQMVMGVGYKAQVTADNVEMSQAKGELTAFGLSFKFFPDATKAQGKEHGAWFIEKAGVIA